MRIKLFFWGVLSGVITALYFQILFGLTALFLMPFAFFIPGLIFGLISGNAFQSVGVMKRQSIFAWTLISILSFVVAFLSLKFLGLQKLEETLPVLVVGVQGLVGAIVLFLGASIISRKFNFIQTVVGITAGALIPVIFSVLVFGESVAGWVVEGLFSFGSEAPLGYSPFFDLLKISAFFAVWQTAVMLPLAGVFKQTEHGEQ